MLLGEGSFHQVHGGVATNSPVSPWADFEAEYVRLRGRRFSPPEVPTIYLGDPSPHALGWLEASARMGRVAAGLASPAGLSNPAEGLDPLQDRYLELLKKALLNETGLEAEAAFFAVRDAMETGAPVDDIALYDVRNRMREHFERVQEARQLGQYFERNPRKVGFAHTMIGRSRLENLQYCVTTALVDQVPGDLVECGVWRGGASIFMRGILATRDVVDRTVWVADSFAGLPAPELPQDTLDLSAEQRPELVVTLERVRANFALYGLLDDQVQFLQGWFKDTLHTAPIEAIAVLRLDGDLYESTMSSLTALYDRVSPGGFVIVDDYTYLPMCRAAVDDFRRTHGIEEPMIEIDWTGVYWRTSP
jgi:hypothetical protein